MAAIEKTTLADSFELEQFLPYRLSQLSNTASQGIAQFYQQSHQLSVPEWRVMAVLGRYPGLTASQLCERTVMDKVTISRAVRSLLDKEFVQRIVDAGDRRKRPLRISTDRGQKALQEVIPFALDYQQALLSGLSPAERSTFDSLMIKLLTAATELNRQQTADQEKKTRGETPPAQNVLEEGNPGRLAGGPPAQGL